MVFTDKQVEQKWIELEDILFDEDEDDKELYLHDNWFLFNKGTHREDIWHWFDQNHSRGVAWLLYDFEF